MRFSHNYAEFFDVHAAQETVVSRTHRDFVTYLAELLMRLGVDEARAADICDDLWRRMTAPSRHYHTPVHVLGMLSCAEEMSLALSDAEQLAVWFHDAIYEVDAAPGDNERQSADWMIEVLSDAGADAAIVHAAAQMIRWTACHLEAEVPPAYQTVLDLDLWGLSAAPDIFSRQSTAVRSEMAHLGEEQYSRNTIAFFQRLLERPRLYRTDTFARFEAAARQQVTSEIRRLAKHVGGNGKH